MLILRAFGVLVFASLALTAPFTPEGGVGTDTPVYHPASDFDFQSLVSPSILFCAFHILTAYHSRLSVIIEFGIESGVY
jgi:hypothetical protein